MKLKKIKITFLKGNCLTFTLLKNYLAPVLYRAVKSSSQVNQRIELPKWLISDAVPKKTRKALYGSSLPVAAQTPWDCHGNACALTIALKPL